MKKIVIAFGALVIGISCFGQGLEVESSISTSSKKEFQNAIGFGISYQFKPIDRLVHFGFGIQQCHKSSSYLQFGDPLTQMIPHSYFSKISFKVKLTSLRFNCLFLLKENENVCWTVGPDLSFNVLRGNFHEHDFHPDSANTFTETEADFNYRKVNTIGFALFSKIEIKNVFIPRLSICFNIRPEIILSGRIASTLDGGWPEPNFYNNPKMLEFQIGLKYNFIRKKIIVE